MSLVPTGESSRGQRSDAWTGLGSVPRDTPGRRQTSAGSRGGCLCPLQQGVTRSDHPLLLGAPAWHRDPQLSFSRGAMPSSSARRALSPFANFRRSESLSLRRSDQLPAFTCYTLMIYGFTWHRGPLHLHCSRGLRLLKPSMGSLGTSPLFVLILTGAVQPPRILP